MLEVLGQFAILAGAVLLAWFVIRKGFRYPFRAVRRRIFGTMLLEHIGALSRLGLPIAKGIGVCAMQPAFGLRKDIERIESGLEEGRLVADVLASVPEKDFLGYNPAHKLLSPSEAEVLRIAEMAGNLEHGVDLVLRERRRLAALRNWAVGVFSYPATVFVAFCSTLSGILTYIVPKFSAMFEELDVELPAMTQYLVSSSDNIDKWLAFLIPLVLSAIVLYKRRSNLMRSLSRGSGRLREAFHRAIYFIPFIHGGIRRAHLGEFCRELAMLLRIGTPAHRALAVIGDGTMNPWFRDRVRHAATLCEQGMTLSVALDKSGLDQRVGWFAHAVTNASNLVAALDILGDEYMQKVSWPLILAVRIVPPAMVMVMAVAVGLVVISLFLPLIQLMLSIG